MAVDSQVCFHRQLFVNQVKLSVCITGPVGQLGSTNQNWLYAKLLPMAISTYSVVCVHPCHLLRAQHHCVWPSGREGLPLACPPTPSPSCPSPTPKTLISAICDITGIVKELSKTSSEYYMAELATKH